MAWELLPVDYTDAVWAGLKRYNQINNEDGSVSFQDITSYTGKEKSFFGAKDANRMNEALNTIMSMVENGTDLYTAFQNYFAEQKTYLSRKRIPKQRSLTTTQIIWNRNTRQAWRLLRVSSSKFTMPGSRL